LHWRITSRLGLVVEAGRAFSRLSETGTTRETIDLLARPHA
jgi:hypothetical protein